MDVLITVRRAIIVSCTLVAIAGGLSDSETSTDGEIVQAKVYINTAMELLQKAKAQLSGGMPSDSDSRTGFRFPPCAMRQNCSDSIRLAPMKLQGHRPVDCSEVRSKESGVYRIYPENAVSRNPLAGFNVYCDMDTDGGGWTVIQRRGDFGRPNDYFDKDWEAYKDGFGDIKKDFWLGNDKIHMITTQKAYRLRFDLKDTMQFTRKAVYDVFFIYDESQDYALQVSGYSGNVGDSFMETHNGMKFSTKDRDNDNSTLDCAMRHKGGWWYNSCLDSNLNGLYWKNSRYLTSGVMTWKSWKTIHQQLKETEIKIRPSFLRMTNSDSL